MTTPSELESEIRAMRDAIYGTEPRYRTDAGWEGCKENWMKPEQVAWLREHTREKKEL